MPCKINKYKSYVILSHSSYVLSNDCTPCKSLLTIWNMTKLKLIPIYFRSAILFRVSFWLHYCLYGSLIKH